MRIVVPAFILVAAITVFGVAATTKPLLAQEISATL